MQDEDKQIGLLIKELSDLRKRNNELEKVEFEHHKVEDTLKLSISLLRATLESTADGILVVDTNGRIVDFNERFVRMWRLSGDVMESKDDRKALNQALHQLKDPQCFLERVMELYSQPQADSFDTLEFKDGRIFERYSCPQWLDDNVIGRVWSFRDVTERRNAVEALQKARNELEETVRERTAALSSVNTALKVLLKQREEDKCEIQERVLSNVRELIMPIIEQLKNCYQDSRYKAYLGVLESNLNEIISPFSLKLSSKYLNLTHTEIQIANFIKEGKCTKEIAGILNISTGTVDTHRDKIRIKLGLKNKKANLRTYLLSIG